MSKSGHIVFLHNKNTPGENMPDMFTSNLWIIMPSMWALFIVYATWYSTKAKQYAPISPTEARQLWVIHTQDSECASKKWRYVKHQGQTVGFECGCGFKHVQRRPIVGRAHVPTVPLAPAVFNTAQPASSSPQN